MKKIILLFLITFSASIFAQIDRMEPPFWYEGMHKTEVQVLFYGKNISQNTVTVSNNVVITNITKTENSNYLFVSIDTKNVKAQELQFTFTNGKKSFKKSYEIKKRKPNSALRKSFDASDVMYLLMPDRFANGNSNKDTS